MTRAECKAEAISHLNQSNHCQTIDGQRNMVLAAQVYAILATIPDDVDSYDDADSYGDDFDSYDDFGL